MPLCSCYVITVSLLLSISLKVCLCPPIERRETRPTAWHPCPRTVWRKKVAQSWTPDQVGDWTQDLLVGMSENLSHCANLANSYQLSPSWIEDCWANEWAVSSNNLREFIESPSNKPPVTISPQCLGSPKPPNIELGENCLVPS